jgi:hypothetical protein
MEGFHIVAMECASACAGEPDLEQRFRKSMKAANGHWMVTNDQEQFKGAIGGVLMAKETTEEEKERINATVRALAAINALISGVPVDMDAMVKRQEEGPEALPIVKWWHETKEAA